MNIQEELIHRGHPNRPGVKLTTHGNLPRAIVFHYTANDAPRATDTMNARYFGRKWMVGPGGAPLEADGKTPFRYGSTQVVVDEDSVTICIPTDEAAWSCGDRNAGAWTPLLRGQKALARNLFDNRQNYQTLSIEICNNASWERACDNAAEYAAAFIRNRGLELMAGQSLVPPDSPKVPVGGIILLRHWDITGKICPKPFVDDGKAWSAFVQKIADAVRK